MGGCILLENEKRLKNQGGIGKILKKGREICVGRNKLRWIVGPPRFCLLETTLFTADSIWKFFS